METLARLFEVGTLPPDLVVGENEAVALFSGEGLRPLELGPGPFVAAIGAAGVGPGERLVIYTASPFTLSLVRDGFDIELQCQFKTSSDRFSQLLERMHHLDSFTLEMELNKQAPGFGDDRDTFEAELRDLATTMGLTISRLQWNGEPQPRPPMLNMGEQISQVDEVMTPEDAIATRVSREDQPPASEVRYFSRMRLGNAYPLQIRIHRPDQAMGLRKGNLLRPVMPGCLVSPPDEVMPALPGEVEFHITPLVPLGFIDGSLQVWQDGTRKSAELVPSRAVTLRSLARAWILLLIWIGIWPFFLLTGTGKRLQDDARPLLDSLGGFDPVWVGGTIFFALLLVVTWFRSRPSRSDFEELG